MARAQTGTLLAPAFREDGARLVKYVAIRNHFLGEILSGALRPGAQLPSEHDIMARFSVSRVTTRQALDMLRAEGRIEARQGKGYYVRPMTATAGLDRLQGLDEMMATLGAPLGAEVLEISETRPAHGVALALGVDPLRHVIRIVQTRRAAGVTVSVDECCLPVAVGRQLIKLDLARRDILTLLEERLGIVLAHADITLDLTPPPDAFAPLIGLAPGEAALTVTRVPHDACGRAIMVQTSFARPGVLRFRMRAER